jgi:hypothetical protein
MTFFVDHDTDNCSLTVVDFHAYVLYPLDQAMKTTGLNIKSALPLVPDQEILSWMVPTSLHPSMGSNQYIFGSIFIFPAPPEDAMSSPVNNISLDRMRSAYGSSASILDITSLW